jgi:DNA adenine methylase
MKLVTSKEGNFSTLVSDCIGDVEYLSETNKGIYLISQQAKMIWQGNKELIIKGLNYKNANGQAFYLIGGNDCYGVIKIKAIKEINLADFKNLESKHRITDLERKKLFPNKKVLFAYEFDFIKKFEEPRRVAVPTGTDNFMEDIKFLDETELIKDVIDYDPVKQPLNILKDDFRIALAWWSEKKQGKEIKHSFEEIENILQLIIEELVRRGIKFHPEKMKPESKEAFERVVSRIKEYVEEELQAQAFGSPGGKNRLSKILVKLIPTHKTYVEPFAGGAALYFRKVPSEIEVLNDIDSGVTETFLFIKNLDAEKFNVFKNKNWIPNRKLFFQLVNSKPTDQLESAYRFMYITKYSYGMDRHSFGMFTKSTTKFLDRFSELKERLKNTVISNEGYEKSIQKYDSPNTFFFIDPPYVGNWRGKENKWTYENAEKLNSILKSVKGKFLLTINYDSNITSIFKSFNIKRHTEPRSLGNRIATNIAFVSNYDLPTEKFAEELDEKPNFLRGFKDMDLIKDFVSVAGSSVKNKEYNDIDFVIRMKEPTDYLKRAVETRITKEYSGEKKLHFIWGDPEGPHDSHIPLFDLQLKKLDSKIVDMAEYAVRPMKEFEPMKPSKKFYSINETVNYMFGDN